MLKLLTLPIGNIKDITVNVLEQLNELDYIVTEDTRSFKNLLTALKIDYSNKTIDSYHDQSGSSKLQKLLKLLCDGKTLGYCSEAGSPIISDPAYPLIKECVKKNIKIQSFGGISSITVALELSGFPVTPFTYKGFLSRDKSDILKEFKSIKSKGTYVYFESPHRIMSTLNILKSSKLNCEVGIARELTKKFETIHRFSILDLEEQIESINAQGEIVLLLYYRGDENKNPYEHTKAYTLAQAVLDKPNKRKMSKLIHEITGDSQENIYMKLTQDRKTE